MKEVGLTKGKVALVDDDDFDKVSLYSWQACEYPHVWYAMTKVKGQTVLMHRFVTGMEAGVKVDHQDGDGLNNQKHNLREATTRQNAQNRRYFGTGSSKYKGVSWQARQSLWVVRVRVSPSKKEYIGCFTSEEIAAKAYDRAAREKFGEFAALNFPVLNERFAL